MRLALFIIGGGAIMAGLLLLPAIPEWVILASCCAWLFGCFAAGIDS